MADSAALECAFGVYLVHPASLWDSGWDPEDVNDLIGDVLHALDLDLDDHASRIFSMVPGWLQTVQRAEYLGEFSLPFKR